MSFNKVQILFQQFHQIILTSLIDRVWKLPRLYKVAYSAGYYYIIVIYLFNFYLKSKQKTFSNLWSYSTEIEIVIENYSLN